MTLSSPELCPKNYLTVNPRLIQINRILNGGSSLLASLIIRLIHLHSDPVTPSFTSFPCPLCLLHKTGHRAACEILVDPLDRARRQCPQSRIPLPFPIPWKHLSCVPPSPSALDAPLVLIISLYGPQNTLKQARTWRHPPIPV